MATGAALAAATHADASSKTNTFHMHRSPGIVAAGCIPDATAKVTVRNRGPVEEMTIHASGLVIQVPNAPFGVAWYQGDLESDKHGEVEGTFVGRFSHETFAVAPGTAPAPLVHDGSFPDATGNPAFGPIHTFRPGLWFNSPRKAARVGCPATVTPFNGVHHAGVQVLNTAQFPDAKGPLGRLQP
ncbi:MAG: hypothetical protein J2P22_18050 [Nocardioides sp.]|nr:hypothetical protein [Nocardioides sp.]